MFQVKPAKASTKYRQYQPSLLTDAYIAVKEKNISVSRASRMYQVPAQTLRDRVLGKIHIDTTTTGRAPVLSLEEEAKLVGHLKEVANLGYGYTRQEVVDIASDYAYALGVRPTDKPLTLNWFVKFAGRWPEIRVVKPRALEIQRAKCTSDEVVENYFAELEKILIKYNLKDKPHLIFNVDEKGVTQDHKPPSIVAGTDYHPNAVTAGRSKTTTILGCGSAGGVAIPPFFVFAGKRMLPELMKGATPGAAGTVSDSGWSNGEVFRKYLEEHFLKFIPNREPDQHILLLLDGHRSHITIGLLDWAKAYNIVLFILPAHTSHVLQPMDVGCYGPFQKMYHDVCHKFTRTTSCTVTRNDVCSLVCKVYNRALSADNLYSAFMKTGISPFDRSVISKECTMPADAFIVEENCDKVGEEMPDNDNIDVDPNQIMNVKSPSSMFSNKLDSMLSSKREINKAPRKHIGKIVSGQPITEPEIYNKINEHVSIQDNNSKGVKRSASGKCVLNKSADMSLEKLWGLKREKGNTVKVKKGKW